MKDFMYSYPTKVYFGDGAAEKALQTELAGTGKTIMLLFLTHAGLAYEELQEIEKMIGEIITFEKVIYQKASPAISINCGPGSFGLLFLVQEGK